MYYLVNVTIHRPLWNPDNDEIFQRLVKAKDKNNAWDKVRVYLTTSYISMENSINEGVSYKIEVEDTID